MLDSDPIPKPVFFAPSPIRRLQTARVGEFMGETPIKTEDADTILACCKSNIDCLFCHRFMGCDRLFQGIWADVNWSGICLLMIKRRFRGL